VDMDWVYRTVYDSLCMKMSSENRSLSRVWKDDCMIGAILFIIGYLGLLYACAVVKDWCNPLSLKHLGRTGRAGLNVSAYASTTYDNLTIL
jgi:hypothetical protein